MIIEPHDDMGGTVLNCAVRYVLGRASHMPGLVMNEIRPKLDNLTTKTLLCIEHDISEKAIADGFVMSSGEPQAGGWQNGLQRQKTGFWMIL